MHPAISSIRYQHIQEKYLLISNRLQKALKNRQFSSYTQAKKQAILRRLSRYERQLKQWGVAVGTSAMLLLPASEVLAQPIPVGGEFRVNTHTALSQANAATAMDSDGDFVIAWQSYGQDGSGFGIYAQRYNNAGVAQGPEFRVNTYTTDHQESPAVSMDSDGDFVITWQSRGQDFSIWGIYAQRYNCGGVAQGSEFRVNTYTMNNQTLPSVAIDIDGDFIITWASKDQDGQFEGVYAQRYNSAGVAIGSEFRVNTYTLGVQTSPCIAIDNDGDFVVSWLSSDQDGSTPGVYAQRYNSAGMVQGSEFQVNTYTIDTQAFPSIAIDSDGDFVITWESEGQDGSNYGIYAQRYNNTGMVQGSEFRVNTYITDHQGYSSIDMDTDGDFVITWISNLQDGHFYGIYGQRYNSGGVADGPEFRVNTYTTQFQRYPSIAMDNDGDFVIAWQSLSQDGNDYGVYAQRYSHPLFPEIVVLGGTTLNNINNGDNSPSIVDGTNFGGVQTCNGSLIFTYRIKNTGAGVLNLGTNAVTLTGSTAFTVFSQPAATVAPGAQTNFKLRFDPSVNGFTLATVAINNNDTDESPFQFAVSGSGLADNIPPGITCPADKIVNLNGNCALLVPAAAAMVSDNCGGTPTQVQSPAVGTLLASGEGVTHTLTITATDASGNTNSCTLLLIGDDKTKPNIICPPDRIINLSANCTWTVPFLTATVSDNCGMVIQSQSPATGTVISSSHNATYTVVITANDNRGNTKSCNVSVTVKDKTRPGITCPSGQSITLNASCSLIVPTLTATTTDNCGPVIVSQNPSAGTILTSGDGMTHTVTMTATDAGGNTRSCQVVLTGDDTTPPTLSCPGNTTIDCADYDNSLGAYGSATATDNCTNPPAISVNFNYSGFDELCLNGTILRTFTATDAALNSSYCTQLIQIVNDNSFSVAFPADVSLNSCDPLTTMAPVISGDDCAIVAVNHSDQVFTNIPDACFKIIRTWTVINWCAYDPIHPFTVVPTPVQSGGAPWVADNTNLGMFEFVQNIYVTDDVAPVLFECYVLNEFCDYSDNGPYFDNGTTNLCEGPVNLTITATDDCATYGLTFDYDIYLDLDGDGNLETSYSSLTTSPFFLNISQNNEEFTATLNIPNDPTWGGQLPYGDHLIFWTVTDVCGNMEGCSKIFSIIDCESPTITCINGLSADLAGTPPMLQIWASSLVDNAYDNCTPSGDLRYRIRIVGSGTGVPGPLETSLILDCSHLGTQVVEVWVGDDEDNWDYCLTYIVVLDNAGNCPILLQSPGNNTVQKTMESDRSFTKLPDNSPPLAAGGFELYQNVPNPFDKNTVIRFVLPEPDEAILTIWDAGGKLLTEKRGLFEAGVQSFTIEAAELPETGVMTYRLSTGQNTASKKMIKF